MKTSRQRLLEYLQNRKTGSADEIGRALKMSRANARHHLAILLSEGVVEVVDRRFHQGRGRPTLLYGLTGQTYLHNLDGLTSALLHDLLSGLEPEAQTAALQRLAGRLCGQGERPHGNLSQKLVQATRSLDDMNYQARWEAHAQAPRVVLEHCPYAAILPEHPELCQMDRYLLMTMLGLPTEQLTRLERNSLGVIQCVFAVKTPS